MSKTAEIDIVDLESLLMSMIDIEEECAVTLRNDALIEVLAEACKING